MKAVVRDMLLHAAGKPPVCAFSLRNGQIYTGSWVPLTQTTNVLVVTLIDKEAPPIYIAVEAIDAIAVDGTS
jgi:hypothetical protein